MPQTSYAINLPAVSFPGQPFDSAVTQDVLSALNVAAAVAFGILLVKDTANTTGPDKLAAKAPSSSGEVTTEGTPLGVVMASQAIPQDPSVATPVYPIKSAVPLMRQGRIWVKPEENVLDGDAAFVRFASGAGGTVLGSFRKSADTATAVALPKAIYRGGMVGSYAMLELNLV
jgi:hypothetical protein